MCFGRGARPVDQLVLEHQRGHDAGRADVEAVEERGPVDVLVEEPQGGLDLASRRTGDARCDGVEVRSRAHRSGGRGDDRDVHLEARDEPLDRVRQLAARR